MKRLLGASVVVLALAFGTIAFAQPWQGGKNCGGPEGREPGRMYDPAKAETMKGRVEAVEQIAGRRGRGQGIGLKLKTDAGTLIVHLGPQWYVEQQGNVKISAGDAVEITGVKARRRDQDVFIAAEVKRGEDVLKLRGENGIPLWAGWRQGGGMGAGRCRGPQS